MKSKFWIIGALLFATRLEAGPVELAFAPPAVPAQTICHKSRGTEAARATWVDPSTDWPRDLSTSEIRRDIKALRDLNAVEFLPVILSIINGLAERDPSYRGKHATLAEIEARLAAGDLQALRDRHLVAQLAAQSTGSSAQITWALARYFRDGIGVEQDADKADAYLVLAAELGHPEALMTLAQRQLAETAPEGWDAPAEATMRRGLERLLGPLNSGVCDRAGRIARLYLEGRGLRADTELAQAWWRFAADLGDAQAAWTVYELQSQAELVTPDTTIRMAYLKQAADAGLPYAQVALGRVYERGALVPRDLQAAFDLYQRTAQTGDRAGMIRLALFLQDHAAAFPEHTPLKINTLQRLADRDDAPGWVYTRLATHSVHTTGRWGDLAAQWALLDKATAAGDRDGMTRLAELLLADRTDPAHFDQALALLGELVTVHGSTGAAKKLHDAHMCRAPDSPRVPEAQFWKAQYLASDPPLPHATKLGQDPLALAAVQAEIAPVDATLRQLARLADQFDDTEKGLAAQHCVLRVLNVWAKARALQNFTSEVSEMTFGARLAGFALIARRLRVAGMSPEALAEVSLWLTGLAHQQRDYWDQKAGAPSQLGNLRAWANLGIWTVGAEIAETTSESRCSEAMARAVGFALSDLDTGARSAALSGVPQSYQSGIEILKPHALAWLEAFLTVAPSQQAEALARDYRPLRNSKLGGNQTKIWQGRGKLTDPQ